MNINKFTNNKVRYTIDANDINAQVIHKLINFVNELSSHQQTIIKYHIREMVNTIQWYLNVDGQLSNDKINDIIATFKFLINQVIILDTAIINKFIKVLIYYAQHQKHYFGGTSKFNWGRINYTKSVSNIFERFGIISNNCKWDVEYMQAILQFSETNSQSTLFNREVISVIRIARATGNLDIIVKMYQDGLNYQIIDKFNNHNGFDGVMLGHPDWPYHIEFTHHNNPESLKIKSVPHPEDALVLYLKDDTIWLKQCENMEYAGFISIKAYNPYWNQCGKTFLDCDGHRIILVKNDWMI